MNDGLVEYLMMSRHGTAIQVVIERLRDFDAYLTGGAVRDFVQGTPADQIHDLDFMVETRSIAPVFQNFDADFPHAITRFGNRSYHIHGSAVDIFPAATASGRPLTAELAVTHLDLTASALLANVRHWRIEDYVGGVDDARARFARPQRNGWCGGVSERVLLVERVVDFLERGVFLSGDWKLLRSSLLEAGRAFGPMAANLATRASLYGVDLS